MNRKDLAEAVRQELPKTRWEHTLRVVDTALELADRFGADREKVDLAALLHDFCKFWPEKRMEKVIRDRDLPRDLLEHNVELWHAFVGAEAVRDRFGIEDGEILDAIRYHTSGRPHMSLLDKIILLADYIEPGRKFPGVEEVRQLAREDLDKAVLKSLDNTLVFLIHRGQKVYPLTLAARNDMVDRVRQPRSKEESL
ncbi:putative HD superfamily hydrolase involved in NAD metabolism [Melghirimyces profundicolus]|uniref:bis(5'-nucleosyl)-tetraphosphatase (symmetrical) n=1 Tax=Melghirimyces profundicolus TaxID=1242148 RepID=A0A2T6C913_9BACL|nr:bis(5'-nucleosyl)-tetraphosphatase (symmetrical) YqeK [Melghirimyces profundicolus]PTX64810.1 putative HD superfamily hydrolase involved in NAD metabolism [Melghirimyces profundicolus]